MITIRFIVIVYTGETADGEQHDVARVVSTITGKSMLCLYCRSGLLVAPYLRKMFNLLEDEVFVEIKTVPIRELLQLQRQTQDYNNTGLHIAAMQIE